jgi:hypothetical protein
MQLVLGFKELNSSIKPSSLTGDLFVSVIYHVEVGR